jgi:hypothetical protein
MTLARRRIWTPNLIGSNLKLWLSDIHRSSLINGSGNVAAIGDTVDIRKDLSGNENHATSLSSGNRATLTGNVHNSTAALLYNGVTQYDTPSINLTGTQKIEIWTIIEVIGSPIWQWALWTPTATFPSNLLYSNGGLGALVSSIAATEGQNSAVNTDGTTYPNQGVFAITRQILDKTQTGANQNKFYINNVLQLSFILTTLSGSFDNVPIRVGRSDGSLIGYNPEILIFDTLIDSLDSNNSSYLLSFLRNYYNIA